jgi:hypothetical protein
MRKAEDFKLKKSHLSKKKRKEEAGVTTVQGPTRIKVVKQHSSPLLDLQPKNKYPQLVQAIMRACQRVLDLQIIKRRSRTIGTI